jgi:exopolysaccharide biosynthesis WecB/TagA/CpsF family protein
MIRTLRVGGVRVAALDRAQTAALTIETALARRGHNTPCPIFTTINGQGISLCASRPDVQSVFEQMDLISADGQSIIFASRLFYRSALPERVATTDAFHDAAALAEQRGARFYILGAVEDVNCRSVARVKEMYPRLEIVGRRNGYFSREEESAVIDAINDAEPDVCWVGLGVPSQQQFLLRNRHRLTRVGVAKTCGGLFDFLSGDRSRAPRWMQAAGLEWAYRAMLEPRRLGKRYLVTNPHAIHCMLTRSGGEAEPFQNPAVAAH